MTLVTTSTVPAAYEIRSPLDELCASLRGEVHAPGEAGWDTARMAWAVQVDQHPFAVAEVADAADVRRCVQWALRHGHQVSAQPVGHGASRQLAGEGMERVLLLRTRALRSIDIDIPRGTVTVGAGVKAGELLAALEGTGLTFLAGSSPDPTVVWQACARRPRRPRRPRRGDGGRRGPRRDPARHWIASCTPSPARPCTSTCPPASGSDTMRPRGGPSRRCAGLGTARSAASGGCPTLIRRSGPPGLALVRSEC